MINFLSLDDYYKIITFFSAGFGFFISALIYFSNPKAVLSRLYVLSTLLTLVYITTPFFVRLPILEKFIPIFFKLAYAAAPVSLLMFYYMILHLFPGLKRHRRLDYFEIFLCASASLLALSPAFIKVINPTQWGPNPILGQIKFFYFAAMVSCVLLVFYYIFKGFFTLSAGERGKYAYFITGFLFFAIGNTLFLIIFPLLGFAAAQYYPFGVFPFIVYVAFTAITIFRKGGFEVKSILTDLLVGIFGVVLLILPIFSEGLLKTASMFIFIFFLVIGYLLIRYTHREVKQKEVLEQLVKERTRELAEKVAELNKWYHLTVGRELRMAELKDENRKLKEKLKNG